MPRPRSGSTTFQLSAATRSWRGSRCLSFENALPAGSLHGRRPAPGNVGGATPAAGASPVRQQEGGRPQPPLLRTLSAVRGPVEMSPLVLLQIDVADFFAAHVHFVPPHAGFRAMLETRRRFLSGRRHSNPADRKGNRRGCRRNRQFNDAAEIDTVPRGRSAPLPPYLRVSECGTPPAPAPLPAVRPAPINPRKELPQKLPGKRNQRRNVPDPPKSGADSIRHKETPPRQDSLRYNTGPKDRSDINSNNAFCFFC